MGFKDIFADTRKQLQSYFGINQPGLGTFGRQVRNTVQPVANFVRQNPSPMRFVQNQMPRFQQTEDYFGVGKPGLGQFGQQVRQNFNPIQNQVKQTFQPVQQAIRPTVNFFRQNPSPASFVQNKVVRPTLNYGANQITNPNSGFNRLANTAENLNTGGYGYAMNKVGNIASAIAPKYKSQIQNALRTPDFMTPKVENKTTQKVGRIGAQVGEFAATLPIGISKVGALEKMSALPKFIGYTGIRAGEGGVFGALEGAGRTGTRQGALEGAKQGAKFSAVANTVLSPKLAYQASKQAFRLPVSRMADNLMQPVASSMGAMPPKGKKGIEDGLDALRAEAGSKLNALVNKGYRKSELLQLPAGQVDALYKKHITESLVNPTKDWTRDARYGRELYHETSPESALRVVASRDTMAPSLDVTNSKDLAIGQGGNGVILVFDPDKAHVKVKTNQKPNSGFLHAQGITDELKLSPNKADKGWVKGVIVKNGTPEINQPGGLTKSFFTNSGIDPNNPEILPNGDRYYKYNDYKLSSPSTEGASSFIKDLEAQQDEILNAKPKNNNVTVKYPEASSADEALGKSDMYRGNYKQILDNWINSRNVARTVGAKKTLDTNIPYKDAQETIKALEGSANPTQTSQMFRGEFDKAYKAAQDAGLDIGYIDDYLTHIWKESPQAVKEKFASASRNFKFAQDRTIPTYEEGIKLGLTPRYDTPQQILGHYTQKLEEVKANIEFFNGLKDEGFIVPASVGANNPSFKAITGPGFPKSTSIVGKGEKVIGAWYAPRDIADDINKVFQIQESPKALNIAAKASGKIQDILLSGGIPKTPVNAFTLAQVTKEVLGGNIKSPVKAFTTALSEAKTTKFLSDNSDQIIKMQKNGINLRSGFDIENLADRGTVKNVFGKSLGEAWDKFVSDPTFKRFMPMLQVNMFNTIEKSAIKAGKSADEASRIASQAVKNFYGLTSATSEAMRSQTANDLLKTFAFAPKYRESMINFWINNVKAVKAPLAKENRNNVIFALTAIATYVGMDQANLAINGVHMKDNPKGKEDKLLIPLGNGKTVGVPFLSSIATVPRAMYRGGKALIQGDIKGATNELFKSNLSAGLKPLVEVAANENYFGEEIYDDYDTSGQKWGKIANYLLNPATGAYGHPYIREGVKFAQGKQGGLETISKATEMPLRWYKTSSIENAGFWEANDIQKQITEIEKLSKYGKVPTEVAQKQIQGLKTKQGKLLNRPNANVAQADTGNDPRIRDLGGYFGITTSKGTDFADTYKEAQKTLAKDDFSKTDANFKDMGDYVLRKSSDGDVTAQPKIQYEADLLEAKKTRFKKNKDLEGWMANAENLAKNYENQLKDKTLDELEKLKIQGKLDDLIAEAQKYAGYGGFTKPKKGKKINISAPKLTSVPRIPIKKATRPSFKTSISTPKIAIQSTKPRQISKSYLAGLR